MTHLLRAFALSSTILTLGTPSAVEQQEQQQQHYRQQVVSYAEIASHDDERTSCYMGISMGRRRLDGSISVYDMTAFLNKHPGGFDKAAKSCGKVNCNWEMRYKGHKFVANSEEKLRRAIESRGGEFIGTLGAFTSADRCMD